MHTASRKITRIKEPTIDIALDTIKMGKQAIIFASTKRSAEKTAEDISKHISKISVELNKISESALFALSSPTKQCHRLARTLKKGIAFHHAGLNSKQKELIEDNFRLGKIKIIASTPTLAAGLDMPAFRTILKDLKRFGARWGYDWIPVLEYEQMAGRAGRPGMEDFGEAICIAKDDKSKDEIYDRYILGTPEPITSKLATEPVLRTYILSLISTGMVKTKTQIFEFFGKTFWAYQYGDMNALELKIENMLKLLLEYGFIESDKKDTEDFMSANDLTDKQDTPYTPTTIGRRVAQLYLDPYTANLIIEALKQTDKKRIVPFSFAHMISNTFEIRPLLRVKKNEFEYIEKVLTKYEDAILGDVPDMYDDEYEFFLDSIKTALFIIDWINERDEEFLLENYNIRPGEISAKLSIADWLTYCAVEFARILKKKHLIKELNRFRQRLKYGVKEELLALLRLKNIGRMRARTLFNKDIKDLGDIKKIDYEVLAKILGKKVAINIKSQVGIEIIDNKKENNNNLLDYL